MIRVGRVLRVHGTRRAVGLRTRPADSELDACGSRLFAAANAPFKPRDASSCKPEATCLTTQR